MVSVVPVTALIVFHFIADNYFNSDCIVVHYSYFLHFTFFIHLYLHLQTTSTNSKLKLNLNPKSKLNSK